MNDQLKKGRWDLLMGLVFARMQTYKQYPKINEDGLVTVFTGN